MISLAAATQSLSGALDETWMLRGRNLDLMSCDQCKVALLISCI